MVIGNRVKTGLRDNNGILFSDKSIFPDDMGIFPDDKFILSDDMRIFLDDKSTFPDDISTFPDGKSILLNNISIFFCDEFIFLDGMRIFLDDKSILDDDLGVSDKPVTLTFLQPWVSTLVKISHSPDSFHFPKGKGRENRLSRIHGLLPPLFQRGGSGWGYWI
jgi:hypothetical protein